MWAIIQLRDRNETPYGTEIIDGTEYYVDDMFDLEDGLILDGYNTKKEALAEVRSMRFAQKIALSFGFQDKKYRWVIVREEDI